MADLLIFPPTTPAGVAAEKAKKKLEKKAKKEKATPPAPTAAAKKGGVPVAAFGIAGLFGGIGLSIAAFIAFSTVCFIVACAYFGVLRPMYDTFLKDSPFPPWSGHDAVMQATLPAPPVQPAPAPEPQAPTRLAHRAPVRHK